jgi:hypothetical protein
MNRRIVSALAGVCLALLLCACGAAPEQQSEAPYTPTAAADEPKEATEPTATEETTEEGETQMLQMRIGETAVAVDWEENESVEALKALCREEPLTISLSMYGGFEQVGPIGTSLPRSDKQTTTQAGDIVLYSGNQIVVFYGSNSWAYTRLGHISDQSAEDMAALLGQGDVTITLWMEAEG